MAPTPKDRKAPQTADEWKAAIEHARGLAQFPNDLCKYLVYALSVSLTSGGKSALQRWRGKYAPRIWLANLACYGSA